MAHRNFLQAGISIGIAKWLALPAVAYPGAPNTWGTWNFYEDSTFIPAQISACTDPDGRLRTLFVDTQGFRYYTENSISHRVHHPIMQSFRPLPGGTILNEVVEATLGDYTSLIGQDDDISELAVAEPTRTSVFSVRGTPGTLVYGGSYRHKLATETFGDTFFPSNSYDGNFIPLGGRRAFESRANEFPLGFGGSEGNLLAALSGPGATQNRIFLTNRTDGDVRLQYYQDRTVPQLSFSKNLSDTLGSSWAVNRKITGGSLAVTPDRRDFYVFVTSRKEGLAGAFSIEARVWHLRTATTTSLDGDGDPVIDIDSVETGIVFADNLSAGEPDSLTYPQILLTSAGEPKWLVYSKRYGTGFQSEVKMDKRTPVTTFVDAQKNLRSIAGGFTANGSSFYGSATGSSAALDRLDRLHLVYQYIFNAASPRWACARESATGTFESSPLSSGLCLGAPALAVGPGGYPYIAYRGNNSNNLSDPKLIIAYPSGLRAAYRDDYEDRDKDGRIGLLEKVQGTSDTVVNTQASPVGPVPSLTPLLSGERVPLLSYQLSIDAVHQAGDHFQITQDTDVIDIRMGYSYGSNSLKNWSAGGFTKIAEVSFASVKNIQLRDNITSIQAPEVSGKAFYRLQVTRTEGPP